MLFIQGAIFFIQTTIEKANNMKYLLTLIILSIIAISDITVTLASGHSITKPENIIFGQDLAISKDSLATSCEKIDVREIKPAQIPGVKNRQMQLDCHGFKMAGKKRLAEFVYKDDKLLLVWILVDSDELGRLEKAMIQAYGAPKYKA